ncbi:nucleolar and spindle-associated protein 1-like isoform X2 [Engraulis encrasicolus]|uniref:nucleolar and spindle-associated protein 1-like isoform X2 n=1 Tax=Engraulis encrasicolus TaxID=184585 RepID=UPI002FD484E3
MELGTLKYTDLRRLAKEVGIKANLKADKLLKALEQHYEQQDGGLLKSARKEVTQDSAPVHGQAAQKQANFVTERRSRVTLKRKHEDLEMKLSPRPVNQVERPSVEPEEKRSSKRKKTSLEKEAVAPVVSEKENKPEKQTEPTSNKIDPDTSVKAEEKTSQRPPGKIPRAAELMSKAKAAKRPVTPNFKKLHEAHFNKMESIDAYVQRKNKTIDSFRNTVNELKTLSETTNMKPVEMKTNPKPVDGTTQPKLKVNGSALFSPAALAKKPGPDKGRVTQLSANKPALKGSAIFKPTVVSTAKINVRFSQGTQDNEHKRSLIKTPARMSPHVQLTSTPARKSSTTQQKTGANTSVLSTSKTPGTTPFVFKANTSMTTTPHGTKRNAFDLKASLSKPLTYKPHTGKLKPFAETQDNTLNKSQTVPSHQKNYKQHKVQTRNDRRVKHTEDRKQKKEKMIGARRGLVMT